MALLDDLKGILSPEEFAKIEGNAAIKTRAAKASELLEWYGDEPSTTTTPATTTTTTTTPAATTTTVPPAFDLGGIERMLDSKLAKVSETIDTKLEAAIKTRGDEFVNNAVKIAVQRNDELNRLYLRHEKVTGKEFDSAEFNTFLEKPENKGRFRTITEAGDAYLAPAVSEKTIAEEVDKRVKAKSGQNQVPGGTPAPANKTIEFFSKRNVAGGTATSTGASRAAALLDRRSAAAQEVAS